MSLPQKGFWTQRDAGCLADEDVGSENSSQTGPMHGHKWLMDTFSPDLLRNKKPALEDVSPIIGNSSTNNFPWNASCLHSNSSQLADHQFDTVRDRHVVDRNFLFSGCGDENLGTKCLSDPYSSYPFMESSMTHTIINDPLKSFWSDGVGAVKVNEVRDSSNENYSSIGHAYGRSDDNTISRGAAYDKTDGNDILFSSTYSNGNRKAVSSGAALSKSDGNFVLMGQSFNIVDGNLTSVGQSTNNDNGVLSVGQFFGLADVNFNAIASSKDRKEDSKAITFGAFPAESETNLSGTQVDGCNALVSNRDAVQASIVPPPEVLHLRASSSPNLTTNCIAKNKRAKTCNKTYAAHPLATPGNEDLHHKNTSIVANTASISTSVRNKAANTSERRSYSNNFPSNVKSLLATGMFDGVHVKYFSWSREHSLRAIIQGTGYLCGCKECNFSKTLTAFEFESHAGCKSKHPNSHIYFQNGKTIFNVVHELKNTPREELFDKIQNVTGSKINEKNFEIWKESYRAATIELQRIFGKKEDSAASS